MTGEEIVAMKEACENQVPYQRTDCPECGYKIETIDDGTLHCKWCGWTSA